MLHPRWPCPGAACPRPSPRPLVPAAADGRAALASSAAPAPESAVVAVGTAAELQSTISGASASQLVVVDFTAQWCMPCQRIAPFLDELSRKHEDVTILKVDIDLPELQEAVESAGVSSVPTFQFYKAGKLVTYFSGADRNKLEDTITLLQKA